MPYQPFNKKILMRLREHGYRLFAAHSFYKNGNATLLIPFKNSINATRYLNTLPSYLNNQLYHEADLLNEIAEGIPSLE